MRTSQAGGRGGGDGFAVGDHALQAGTDFRDLVYRHSEEPGAERGGAVQLGPDTLVPEELLAGAVREALRNATVGKPVGPVQVPGALALFCAEEIREPEPVPFAEVSASIQAKLQRQARREALTSYLKNLRQRADVKIAD